MKELRKLTRRADNFTNELDVGFSTDILENVVNIPDDQNTVNFLIFQIGLGNQYQI